MSSSISQRLSSLRRLLSKQRVDAFIVPTADAHQSEYVCEADKRRAFLTGFTGSWGTALVTMDRALLWTDGRYFAQAEKQLALSSPSSASSSASSSSGVPISPSSSVPSDGWTLMKYGQPDVPMLENWVADSLSEGKRVGIDPFVTPITQYQSLLDLLKPKKLELVPLVPNPVDVVWEETGTKPPRPSHLVFVHDLKYAGVSVEDKVKAIQGDMESEKVDALIVAALDEVAWLFNLRGSDITFNPVFFAYGLVTKDGATLYIEGKKLDNYVCRHLSAAKVNIKEYNTIFDDLKALSDNKRIWMDPNQCNVAVFQCVPEKNIMCKQSPIAIRKALKNPAELEGMRQCHVRDAAALISYLAWLEDELNSHESKTKWNEFTAAEKLEWFRSQQKDYVGLSFDTISASGPNGAIIHYKPNRNDCLPVTKDQLYLVDSGGQYHDGTTDITRTVHFGEPTAHQKACFTRVLQGHIALARAVFPKGTTGADLDVYARGPLWRVGLDYMHGTGHGVGAFLNVHEGPHGISSTKRTSSVRTTPLQPGMTVTNEPGYYEDGAFGIRIESVMIVVEANTPFKFGSKPYYSFETISLCPLQKKMLDLSLLSVDEIQWINDFHRKCLDKVGPPLKTFAARAYEWFVEATKPIPVD